MKTILTLTLVLAGCNPPESVAGSEAELRRGQFCGGIAGIQCPTGYDCIDDPSDKCDPRRGGADCGGICVRRGKPDHCDYRVPGLHFVGKSVDECSVIRFACAADQEYFSNACGCGCADLCTSQECGPAPLAPNYLCPDGVSVGGPGPCLRSSDGKCGWTWQTCPESCPIIDCAAPPAGCHYEGMVTSPCDQQTCGKLVCDGTNL